MKYFVIVVLFAAIVTARVKPKNDFEKGILKLIEKGKKGDVKSLPVPFPSLNPLILPPDTNRDGQYTMDIGEKQVHGISKMKVEKLSASSSQLSLQFSIPRIQVRSEHYHLKRDPILFIRIVDNQGTFKCDVENLKVNVNVKFRASGRNTVISSMRLTYSIDDLQMYLSGANSLVTKRVRDRVLEVLYHNDTKELIISVVKALSEKYLHGHTPKEFIKIISEL